MNEHDSERIAGLLEMDGLEQTESFDDADVIVLNTSCNRETSDSNLTGQLGSLKKLQEAEVQGEVPQPREFLQRARHLHKKIRGVHSCRINITSNFKFIL